METLSFGLSRLRPRGVIVLAAGVAVALILCTGCGRRVVINNPPPTVIQNSPPPTATASSREVIVLKEAPPPPRQETMPAQPSGEYIWVAGYWTARDGRQEWVAGSLGDAAALGSGLDRAPLGTPGRRLRFYRGPLAIIVNRSHAPGMVHFLRETSAGNWRLERHEHAFIFPSPGTPDF